MTLRVPEGRNMDNRMSCTRLRVLKELSSLSEDRVDIGHKSKSFRGSINVGDVIGNRPDSIVEVEGTKALENQEKVKHEHSDKSLSLPAALGTQPICLARKISEVHPHRVPGKIALRFKSMFDLFSFKGPRQSNNAVITKIVTSITEPLKQTKAAFILKKLFSNNQESNEENIKF